MTETLVAAAAVWYRDGHSLTTVADEFKIHARTLAREFREGRSRDQATARVALNRHRHVGAATNDRPRWATCSPAPERSWSVSGNGEAGRRSSCPPTERTSHLTTIKFVCGLVGVGVSRRR